jgi:hypothetical protein
MLKDVAVLSIPQILEERWMQGLIKSPAHMKRFVPHSPVTGPVVIDSKDVSANRLAGKRRRSTSMLQPEGFDQPAHDARNVLSALHLYCELLSEPGVLTAGNGHYAQELGAISDTASKLVERLSASRRTGLARGDKTAARRSPGWRAR